MNHKKVHERLETKKTIASVCCESVSRPHRTTSAVTGVRPWHLPKWFVGWTMIAWAAKHHAVWRYTPTISGLNSSSVAPCHVGEQLRHGQGMWGDQLHIAILGSMASLYDLGCWGGRYPMRAAKHKAISDPLADLGTTEIRPEGFALSSYWLATLVMSTCFFNKPQTAVSLGGYQLSIIWSLYGKVPNNPGLALDLLDPTSWSKARPPFLHTKKNTVLLSWLVCMHIVYYI